MDYILLGLKIASSVDNLFYCFVGVFVGTLIGVLPGIGPIGAIALLLPLSFGMNPTSAIILLAGIYYGSQYGGSTTSILVNIPGETASVVTTLDGYQMARQGRAGPALGMAAFGSFIGGTVGAVFLMALAAPLSIVTLRFGPPEYVALMVLGLTLVTYLSRGSMLKAIIMALAGVALGQVGIDLVSGRPRFTFGIMELEDGVGLVPVLMGLFGVAEVLVSLEESKAFDVMKARITGLLPNWKDWKDSLGAITRGTILGFFLGMLPGGGAVIASFVSYGVEKRVSRHPEKLGTGAIEGVAGPETANNAATVGAFIPLFALGIPSNAATALLLGALMIHGLVPGPMLLKEHPEVFWGTAVSMYIGNIMLLVLNLPLIGLWVKVLEIPARFLYPLIMFFSIVGAYSEHKSVFDVNIMLVFGLIGYLLRKAAYEPAPLALAFVLTPLLENALRQSLIMSDGSFSIFLYRPLAAVGFGIAVVLLSVSCFSGLRRPPALAQGPGPDASDPDNQSEQTLRAPRPLA